MDRIRTIATAGIVAGSVALAAALLSSGGVGASFVDAAEASASISVADHLDGLEPSPCTFTLYLDGKAVDLGNGQLPFDLSPFATDSGDGTFTAALDFGVNSPDPQDFDVQSDVTPAGDLTFHTTSNSHGVTVTFWWPKPSRDHHVNGSAFITLTCTPRSDHAGDHGGDDHDGSGHPQQDGSARIGGSHALKSRPQHGDDGNPDLPPATFTMEATIGADRSDPRCDSHDTATPDDCTTGDQSPSEEITQPDGAIQPGNQTQANDTTTSEGSTQSVDSGLIDAIDPHGSPTPDPNS